MKWNIIRKVIISLYIKKISIICYLILQEKLFFTHHLNSLANRFFHSLKYINTIIHLKKILRSIIHQKFRNIINRTMNILLYYHFIIYYIYHSANISKHDEMMTAARSTFSNVRFHGMWSRSFDHTVCNAQLSSLWSVRLLCSIMQMMQRVRCACTHSARRFGSRLWSLTDCVDPSVQLSSLITMIYHAPHRESRWFSNSVLILIWQRIGHSLMRITWVRSVCHWSAFARWKNSKGCIFQSE